MKKVTRQLLRRSRLMGRRLMPTPATVARGRRFIVLLKRYTVLEQMCKVVHYICDGSR